MCKITLCLFIVPMKKHTFLSIVKFKKTMYNKEELNESTKQTCNER